MQINVSSEICGQFLMYTEMIKRKLILFSVTIPGIPYGVNETTRPMCFLFQRGIQGCNGRLCGVWQTDTYM